MFKNQMEGPVMRLKRSKEKQSVSEEFSRIIILTNAELSLLQFH